MEANHPDVATIADCIATATAEMAANVASISSTLTNKNSLIRNLAALPACESTPQLAAIINKLGAFDSNFDQDLDRILATVEDENLIARLLLLKKQIGDYRFTDATQTLTLLLMDLDT